MEMPVYKAPTVDQAKADVKEAQRQFNLAQGRLFNAKDELRRAKEKAGK